MIQHVLVILPFKYQIAQMVVPELCDGSIERIRAVQGARIELNSLHGHAAPGTFEMQSNTRKVITIEQ